MSVCLRVAVYTSVTALQDACVCLFACGHIPKILIERTDIRTFQICTRAKALRLRCKLTQTDPTIELHADGSAESDRGLLTV